jgi:hypothetical protein
MALDTPATVSNFQSGTVTTTSTTFVAVGTDCAVTFVAPTTGRVKIHVAGRMINSNVNGTLMAPQTRAGGTIGSGTIIEDATDNNSTSNYGTTFSRVGSTHLLAGLTPGAVYNTRILMRCSVNTETATFALRELIVEPAT